LLFNVVLSPIAFVTAAWIGSEVTSDNISDCIDLPISSLDKELWRDAGGAWVAF
jgi:hypothetical protein